MALSFDQDVRRWTAYLDRRRRALAPFGLFLGEFLKEPAMVGSALPSSHQLVNRLLEPVDWGRIGLCIEFGAGTGRFTQAVLDRLHPEARLIALDTSPGFTRHLRTSIADPRLRPVTASAADVRWVAAEEGFARADCILSGVPFSTLPRPTGELIMDASRSLLGHDGLFIAYQVRDAIEPLLQARFFDVRHAYAWRNMPPCHLYWARNPRPI